MEQWVAEIQSQRDRKRRAENPSELEDDQPQGAVEWQAPKRSLPRAGGAGGRGGGGEDGGREDGGAGKKPRLAGPAVREPGGFHSALAKLDAYRAARLSEDQSANRTLHGGPISNQRLSEDQEAQLRVVANQTALGHKAAQEVLQATLDLKRIGIEKRVGADRLVHGYLVRFVMRTTGLSGEFYVYPPGEVKPIRAMRALKEHLRLPA